MSDANKKIAVVTGGAGFVGSHLCERLVKEGYAVISLDNYFTGSPSNHVSGVAYRTGHTKDISAHITETRDILFHLGEYARTEKSFEDIEYVWDLNKTGTFAVLEFCRHHGCKLVYAGSSTKFADGGDGRNQSPYAWTKATNTELVNNYADWFGLEYAIVYFYNVYGPREMSGAYGTLNSIFTELTKHGQPLTVTAPGTQTRNFTHVTDIINGLLLVADQGNGDGYGIGADESYSVLEVAKMFQGEIIMMPERKGNRQQAGVDNTKVKELGWRQSMKLETWLQQVKTEVVSQAEAPRVLVFSTTYFPTAGVAEEALYDLCKALPQITFDIVTTKFSPESDQYINDLPNVVLHRVGKGRVSDKYLLPFAGVTVAKQLKARHQYLFTWSLMASYGAVTALRARQKNTEPLLITLADQNLHSLPWWVRGILTYALREADQVYATANDQSNLALSLSKRRNLVRSIGAGDAFANQIRFVYSNFFRERTNQQN